jgi:hypothetical protein
MEAFLRHFHARVEQDAHSLLRTSFSNTTSNDIGNDISGLNECKYQLADFAQAADRVEVRFPKSTNPSNNKTLFLIENDIKHTLGYSVTNPK